MSEKTHKAVALTGGIAFVVVAALLQAHLSVKADHVFEVVMSVLGALGFGYAKPVFGAPTASAADPKESK